MKDIFLLDADETLLDFRRGEREQLIRTLSALGIAVSEEMLARFHVINDGLWKKLERGEIARKELVVERFRLLFEEYSLSASAEVASPLYRSNMKDAAYLMPGAEAFLKALKARGRIYVVTNGAREIQISRLKKSGIENFADGVFISEDIGFDKPSGKFAEYVETHIPCYERSRVVWLGDSVTSDMGCAKTKNIDFVLFAKERPEGYTGLLATSFEEALLLFDGL